MKDKGKVISKDKTRRKTKQILDNLKEKTRYFKMVKETLGRTLFELASEEATDMS